MALPRLDLLIYAHDGRGLGHASRSIAVGMAARRLFPEMKVLFVSGSKATAALIHHVRLDWIKLPSYETVVIKGKSHGRSGHSNFSDIDLGRQRAELLKSIVSTYRPRCVLVDHKPQGKHKELRLALNSAQPAETSWVLGIRGVLGGVEGAWSELAVSTFKAHYHALLWYGDSKILGQSHMEVLQAQFGIPPIEVGYVSRLSEMIHWDPSLRRSIPNLAGTVSIPWTGEASISFLHQLAQALKWVGDKQGEWHIFVGFQDINQGRDRAMALFKDMPFCFMEEVGARYLKSLLNSRVSIIYGGYNSLTDVLCAQIPSVVILRGMQDKEQEDHAFKLANHTAGMIFINEKEADSDRLYEALQVQLKGPKSMRSSLNLNGAETAARYMKRLVKRV